MTKRKHLKRRVRQRAAKTGESYTAALRHLRATSEERPNMSNPDATTITRSCSFCRKRQDEVKKLIAGPGVYICDECIMLSNAIIGAEDAPEKAPTLEDGPVERLLGIFTGMVETSRTMEEHLTQWARKLTARGVTPARIAAAAGLTEAEAAERFGL